jgi:hypothetical protein
MGLFSNPFASNLKTDITAGKSQDIYSGYLNHAIDYEVFRIADTNLGGNAIQFNKKFKALSAWAGFFVGPATAEFHGIQSAFPAIRDENRNAIIPQFQTKIENRTYYLSVKGCGAIEDMFTGSPLTKNGLIAACRDKALIPRIENLTKFEGFIMGENWMGESPYGAQGDDNGKDELRFSELCGSSPVAIQGAHICPLVALVRCPTAIEETARKFFWFRTYKKPFYQSIRLVPSRVRLYFESQEVIEDPENNLAKFGIETADDLRKFELNFIRSGIALLTLYARSAVVSNGNVSGLVYQDVWMDKDAIIAPDGVIHFADLEGLDFHSVPIAEYSRIQLAEWHKLVFEFLYALIKIDSYRRKIDGFPENFNSQRQELAVLVQNALENDPLIAAITKDNHQYLKLQAEGLPTIEIPFFEILTSKLQKNQY